MTIWAQIAETPWWFYGLVVVFLKLGFDATKPRVSSPNLIFLLPILATGAFFLSLISFLSFNLLNAVCFGSAILLGLMLGALQVRALKIRGIAGEKKIYIPGSYLLLLLVPFFLFIRYYYNFQLFNFAMQFKNPAVAPNLFFLFGLLIGMTSGRSLQIFRYIKYGPYMTV